MAKLTEDDPLRNDLTKILNATNKATSLTNGLLAYSRRVPMLFHPVNINDVIMNLDRFLSRIIGEDIELTITPSRGNLPVLADTGQIEQVVMNLAANSRDAMPNGGKIAIGLSEAHMDRVFINSHGYGAEGRYALISFSDNGVGMDKTIQQRIFEPFFTTKDVGKGTGLGLSIVYGIVKQHNGYINLYSEPGYGTRFRIYLPLTDMQGESTTVVEQTPVKGKGETILLIEDDDGVRSFTRETLHCFDYRVLEAGNGDRAMEIFLKYADEIDLILSDIVMPHKSGRETMEEILTLKEDVKILYMSGYTGEMIAGRGIDMERMELLSKPFTPNALLAKVREILDGSGG
jgi:CheY-like chemotaxis protein